jgi:hypothetical protein
MGEAKEIVLKPIPADEANDLVKRVHYSGKVVQNSQIHIGVYYHGKLEGAMQFGPSLDKRKIQGLVSGTQWHEFIELNRMAFSDALPRNSESRALGIAMKLLRKHAPQLKWVVTFADGAQCGDGTIYRAAGFILTGIKENNQIVEFPDGYRETRAELTGTSWATIRKVAQRYGADITGGASLKPFLDVGARMVAGYMVRYIYFLDPSYRARLTVPELPYSEIERRGAGMYKGHKRGAGEIDSAAGTNPQTGGASPTAPLLLEKLDN